VLRGDGLPFDAPHLFSDTFGRPDRLASIFIVDGNGRLLRRADLSSVGRGLSRIRATARRLSAVMLAATVKDHLVGNAPLLGPAVSLSSSHRPAPLSTRLEGWVRHGTRTFRKAVHTDFWHIGIMDAPIASVLTSPMPRTVRWIKGPAGTVYHADPFSHPEVPDEIWCERYDYATHHGVLERMRLTGGQLQPTGDLYAPIHRSFPFMANLSGDRDNDWASDGGYDGGNAWADDAVAIPEASAGGQTVLYRLAPDGGLGEPIATLPVPGIDPVLFRWQNRLWLALTRADLDNRSNLCLWHAPTPSGPWTPHTCNPVKLDVRSSRGGGTPFVHEGTLYRPAQDCSRTYGGCVTVNRVLDLTPDTFREEVAAVVAPAPGWPAPHGLHTLSAFGDQTLFDAKCEVPAISTVAARVRTRLLRRLRTSQSPAATPGPLPQS